MSDPGSSGAQKPKSPKKAVSPARNAVGLVVLIGVLVFGWFEYKAKSAYSAAVTAVNERMQDENKELMTDQEFEGLIGKPADGPGVDVKENAYNFTKKTYTWPGLLKSYTLTAFYTKGASPGLHHIETEGEKYTPEKVAPPPANPGRSIAKTKTEPAPEKTATDATPKKTVTDAPPAKVADPASAKTAPDAAPKKAPTDAPPAKVADPVPAKTAP